MDTTYRLDGRAPAYVRVPDRVPNTGRIRAAAKHPRLMVYRRLMAAVLVANFTLLAVQLRRGHLHLADGSALARLSDLTLVNLAAAVLIRHQTVLNVLHELAGRGSPEWPTWIRWSISKVHHVGGIHAGAAIAGTAWLGAFSAVAVITRLSHPGVVTSTTFVLSMACWRRFWSS